MVPTTDPAAREAEEAATVGVRIWDAPIRLFHWALVAALGFSWWSGERHAMDWHRLSGTVILGLLIFRIYWGVVGSRTARFAQFVKGPRATLAYVRALADRSHGATLGHNPVGGWSVLLMLAMLIAMVGSGLFAVDVDGLESGPLADYVSFEQGRSAAALHHFVFDLLLAVVAIHGLAVLLYRVALGHDLVLPMIHGRRRIAAADVRPADSVAPVWKAALGVLIAGGCAYIVARGFRL